MMVERGLSRRRITIISSILNVSGWPLIILIPFLFGPGPAPYKVWIFIGLSAGLQLFSNISGNARGSWFGDLIPAEARGKFFGRTVMFGGIIGAVFAIVEGLFLDSIKAEGIKAYSWLFAFGAIFGLANALLFVPQADIPLPRHKLSDDFRGMVAGTFANGPFLRMAVYHCVWIMACFAGPFYNTFALRDLKMPFLGLGILNSVGTVTMLLTSGFWGKIVDRYGCRPVLILCTLLISPLPLPWLVLHSVSAAYWVMPWANMISGFASAGVVVGVSTLLYKLTPNAGRSVQFAVYSIIVTLAAAPLPAVGGNLPDWLNLIPWLGRHGFQADLRCVFCVAAGLFFLAALAARRIREPASRGTADLIRNLPGHVFYPGSLDELQRVV